MSGDLRDLYQEVVLEHSKRPRNYRAMPDATSTAQGFNPLCGDQLNLYVKVEGDVVKEVSFVGQGCAISRASASLLTGAVKDKTKEEALRLFEKVHLLVTEGPSKVSPEEVGKLAVLSGVSEFPARVKCASLAWHTLKAALEGQTSVSTE
ncbi:MAG TPA: SUF system NifU family Fe-S cluster assembly protein [Myxococcales bacterium]|jgi:nitrogen fixation NifU-like protein|nr:SUF system NifU family Fe-S cluster assembly protein [Myxococcales bacterium]